MVVQLEVFLFGRGVGKEEGRLFEHVIKTPSVRASIVVSMRYRRLFAVLIAFSLRCVSNLDAFAVSDELIQSPR